MIAPQILGTVPYPDTILRSVRGVRSFLRYVALEISYSKDSCFLIIYRQWLISAWRTYGAGVGRHSWAASKANVASQCSPA